MDAVDRFNKAFPTGHSDPDGPDTPFCKVLCSQALDNMIMRPLCDKVILVLILVLKVPQVQVFAALEKITEWTKRQISGLFGGISGLNR